MFSRGALGVLTVVIAEYLAFGFAAGLVGRSVVIWVSLAAFIAGSLLLRRHVPAMVRGVGASDHGLLAMAGLLLLIPGFLTGAAGLALLVPQVRLRVRSRVRQRVDAILGRGFAGSGRFNVSFANVGRYSRQDFIDVEEHRGGGAQGDIVNEDTPKSAPRELD